MTNTTLESGIQEGSIAVLAIYLLASLVLNILVLVTFFRVKKLYKYEYNYFLAVLTFVDVIASLLWLLICLISAIQWEWALTSGYCQFHGVLSMFWLGSNMHMLFAVAIERCMLLIKPSKHDEMFNQTTVIALLLSIGVFDLVIALFPIMGWSEVAFSPYQFQCTQQYMMSESHIEFTLVIVWCLPFILSMFCYAAATGRVFYVRRKMMKNGGHGGNLILEENLDVPWTPYAIKLKKLQMKMKRLNFSTDKNEEAEELLDGDSAGKDDGYASDDSDVPVDDDEGVSDYVGPAKKRVYALKRSDVRLTITLFCCTLFFALLQLPTEILAYVWGFNWLDPPANATITITAIVAPIGLFLKPIVYATNRDLRRYLLQALRPTQEFAEGKKKKKSEMETTEEDNTPKQPFARDMSDDVQV